MVQRRTLLTGLGLALLPQRLFAQGQTLDTLLSGTMSPALLRSLRVALATPAMVAGWQRRGYAAELLADGLRAAGQPAAVTVQDKWHIGSITKGFTALLFARAVEAGVIGWDTRLGDRLSGVPRPYRKVTGIELLSHHAGLPADIALPDLLALPRIENDARASRQRYVELALALPPAAKPRSTFSYSNCGPVLAARMLEVATGKSWEDLLQQQVLDPLGLTSAGFGAPTGDQPRGHDRGVPILQDNPAAMGPAGRLHMSMPDLLTYLAAHRDRNALLSQAGWAQLHTPRFASNHALGWFVGRQGALWHNGSNTAWYAEAAVEPGSGLIMAHCSNDAALLNRLQVLLPAIRRAAGVPA
ncbi:serine hydrolase domain-containing protein [Novosphingobium sp. B 225]|uniref:serine hydrolase domain-containing protein n=1 Tax=Novosphingobium sp. B 225 TaxID=1961849 RepID=UPI0015962885|nr:serine hydrolase domain-containing protein [Novosphingobium sp. B 225]